MKFTDPSKPVYQLIVLPNTGMQMCRGFKCPHYPKEELWKAAARLSKEQADNTIIKLIADHVPCNRAIEATAWIACDPNDFVFFRLTWVGNEPYLDLIIDTQNGGGSQINNKIPVLLEGGFWPLRRQYHLADIYVNEHCKAGNELGSLIIDFGNSGSTFVFSKAGTGPLRARIVEFNNPFDPRFKDRAPSGRSIIRSNMIVLRVGKAAESPWLVLGDRAEELIREYPFTTYLYAPKKYVRDWPDHLKAQEPAMIFRGIAGQVDGLHPMLVFVQRTLEAMLEQIIGSLTNPQGNSDAPEFYPQVTRLMLTYPLTWREVDRTIFRSMLEKACARLLYQEPRIREQFKVELVCSEPVAVVAYVLWENFFHFGTSNLSLAASTLGNIRGTPELRVLVLDIGGGSTDIAYVDIGWSIKPDDNSVDVTFKMLESMRFNRAGDRISHLLTTAIWEFLREKYSINESLDFGIEFREPAFTKPYKRQAVSEISQLAEAAKAALTSEHAYWILEPASEYELTRPFLPLLKGGESELRRKAEEEPRLKLNCEVLKAWVEADCQSLETNSEPGFMDIFLYLEELGHTLRANNRTPHIVVLRACFKNPKSG